MRKCTCVPAHKPPLAQKAASKVNHETRSSEERVGVELHNPRTAPSTAFFFLTFFGLVN